MRKRRLALLGILALCVGTGTILLTRPQPAAALAQATGPTYKGHTLREWVLLSGDARNVPEMGEATRTIREIGPDTLPFLLAWMPYEPPSWRRDLASLSLRLPSKLRSAALHDRLLGRERMLLAMRSYGALAFLRPNADAVTNQLYRMLTQPGFGRNTRHNAARVMAASEGNTAQVLNLLLSALASPDPDTRTAAAIGINQLSYRFAFDPMRFSAIPALVHSLGDTNAEVICNSLSTLCILRADRQQVLPALTNLLTHPNLEVRQRTETAFAYLGGIHIRSTNQPPAQPPTR